MGGEAFHTSLFVHNPDGIYSCDIDGNLLDANPAFEQMVGYTVEELKQLTLNAILLPEHMEKRERKVNEVLKGKRQHYELAMIHKSGRRIDTKVRSFPIVVDGEIVGIYKIVKDITEDKRLKEDLQVTRQQLDLFLNNSMDSIIVFDTEHRVLKVNEMFEKVFGWKEQELIGKEAPFIPDYLMDEKESVVQKVIHDRHVVTVETVRKRKDGELVHVSTFITPIFNEAGQVTAYVSTIRDISNRIQIEQALKESERRLRTLINAMPDIVIFKDGEGKWIEANPCILSFLNIQGADYKGKTDRELCKVADDFYREFLLNCEKTDQMAWANEGMTHLEETLIQKNGQTVTFDVIKVPIFYPDGSKKALLVIGRDITERKRTEKLLRKSEKLAVVGQLSAGIAHEIRNPLTALKGFLTLLQKDDKQGNGWYFDVMLSEIDRIESITNQFMAAAKPQAVSYEWHDMHKLLSNVLTIILPEAIMNDIEVVIDEQEKLPPIKCEVNQMKQVFINVLKNAIESMPHGGKITVQTVKVDEEQILLRVTDTGEGIPKERLPYLGEPFYSLKEKGTGLGLMMCYKIIEEHQGKIHITSKVNEGTTVDIILPVHEPQKLAASGKEI